MATELAYGLSAKGHDVEVFCLERGIAAHREAPFKCHGIEPKWSLYREYPVVSFSLNAFRALLRRHSECPFDVSHAMNFNNYGLTFWRRNMTAAGLAHVSTGFETTQMELAAKWTEFKAKPSLHCLAQIVMEAYLAPWQRSYLGWAECVSTEDIETKAGLIKMGIAADRIELIPSGIDLNRIERAKTETSLPHPWLKGKRYWLCPGRVDSRKGTQFLLKAFAQFSRQNPSIHLVFAGGGRGDYIDHMRQLMEHLGLVDRVLFTGKIDTMLPYYRHCEAVIIPSLSEGIPITLQEALAFEKPILCSKLEGTYHYAKQLQSIIWAEPADVSSFYKGLLELAQDEGRALAIAKGLEFIRGYDWSHVTQAYLELYQRAVALRPCHRPLDQ